jgi:hypothetical protein
MTDEFDPDDFEAIDEFLTDASDYSLAGHFVRNASEAELTKLLADSWAYMRAFADMVADYAMVIRRNPTEEMVKGMTPGLVEASERMLAILPKPVEGDG